MTIKELSTIFFGSVKIQRSRVYPHHRYIFDNLYEGKLANLTDESVLGATINVMSNTTTNNEPLMIITVY